MCLLRRSSSTTVFRYIVRTESWTRDHEVVRSCGILDWGAVPAFCSVLVMAGPLLAGTASNRGSAFSATDSLVLAMVVQRQRRARPKEETAREARLGRQGLDCAFRWSFLESSFCVYPVSERRSRVSADVVNDLVWPAGDMWCTNTGPSDKV